MLGARWQLWRKAYESGEMCGATFAPVGWRWVANCNLPPDHELPHEDRRGFGTVVHATWPFEPTPARFEIPPWPTGRAGRKQSEA